NVDARNCAADRACGVNSGHIEAMFALNDQKPFYSVYEGAEPTCVSAIDPDEGIRPYDVSNEAGHCFRPKCKLHSNLRRLSIWVMDIHGSLVIAWQNGGRPLRCPRNI